MTYSIAKWILLIQKLYEKDNVTMKYLSKKLDIDYSYTMKIINQLSKDKYVYVVKKGRSNFVTLTKKGKKLLNIRLVYLTNFLNYNGAKFDFKA